MPVSTARNTHTTVLSVVDERTGARHADVRLGGLWNRHGLKGRNAACGRGGFNQN
jgi:hypothetical protein